MRSVLFVVLVGCVDVAGPGGMPGDGVEGGSDTGVVDTEQPEQPESPEDPELPEEPPPVDTDEPVQPPPLVYVPTPAANLPRGQAWVHHNLAFVSGLAPHIDGPPGSEVDRYYDEFNATAAHLWEEALPNKEAAWAAAAHPAHRWVSWVRPDGTSQDGFQVIGGVGANPPGRIGYQVGDEPRDWTDVFAIDEGVAVVRAADPEGLIIVNLGTPDNNDMGEFADYAEHYAANPDVDVVSYDLYSTGYGEYERLEIIREAALNHDKPYWRYLKAFDELGETDWPHESDLRWDAYVGLVYGFTGHTWFLYEIPAFGGMHTAFFDNPGSWAHTPNARFHQAADLNARVSQYSRVVTQLTSTDVCFIPVTPLYRPDFTRGWSPGAGGDPFLTSVGPTNLGFLENQDTLVGFFEDNQGETYVMLQNPQRESADWPVFLSGDADFRLTFDFGSASVDTTQLERFDPVSGQVGSLPLTATGPHTAELTVNLEAGDVLLFKYATGMPWAMQP